MEVGPANPAAVTCNRTSSPRGSGPDIAHAERLAGVNARFTLHGHISVAVQPPSTTSVCPVT